MTCHFISISYKIKYKLANKLLTKWKNSFKKSRNPMEMICLLNRIPAKRYNFKDNKRKNKMKLFISRNNWVK